ncbi:MAG: ZIP family metal transporter [Candidatus Buchananbacteria bacterium]
MTIFLLTLATVLATLLGGYLATKFSQQLHYVLAFSAGSLIAVAIFDLIPESYNLSNLTKLNNDYLSWGIMLGFVLLFLLQRLAILHSCPEGEKCSRAQHQHLGTTKIFSLILHSFFDGLIIGLGFKVSVALGLSLAVAIIFHKLADGITTVSISLFHHQTLSQSYFWLLAVALAPLLGATLGYFVLLPIYILAIILAIFAGSFIYLGAADLLPEAHHEHSSWALIFATLGGMLMIFIITLLE